MSYLQILRMQHSLTIRIFETMIGNMQIRKEHPLPFLFEFHHSLIAINNQLSFPPLDSDLHLPPISMPLLIPHLIHLDLAHSRTALLTARLVDSFLPGGGETLGSLPVHKHQIDETSRSQHQSVSYERMNQLILAPDPRQTRGGWSRQKPDTVARG